MRDVLAFFYGLFVVFMLIICVITPDKTKHGDYTNVIDYWTDNEYFHANF